MNGCMIIWMDGCIDGCVCMWGRGSDGRTGSRSLTIYPADELFQGLDFLLDARLGKRVVVLKKGRTRQGLFTMGNGGSGKYLIFHY